MNTGGVALRFYAAGRKAGDAPEGEGSMQYCGRPEADAGEVKGKAGVEEGGGDGEIVEEHGCDEESFGAGGFIVGYGPACDAEGEECGAGDACDDQAGGGVEGRAE